MALKQTLKSNGDAKVETKLKVKPKVVSKTTATASPTNAPKSLKRGLALAGGGPLGAMYEIGVLLALDEALEGLDFNKFDIYVGVSAGSFITAGLANNITPNEIFKLFIENRAADKGIAKRGGGKETLRPELFLTPAWNEYFSRAKTLPPLLAKALLRTLSHPFSGSLLDKFAGLTRALPTGLFDNTSIRLFLKKTFSEPGRSDDFRQLKPQLFSVATDLDTGESVAFGGVGFEHVPISVAVQASAALPGLFPPVEIDGHYYVDGALKKTLNASVAMQEGAKFVLAVNPLVPFDANYAKRRGKQEMEKLVEGGLPTVLSQTFRALIHSRMHVSLQKYQTMYEDCDVVLFEPNKDDAKMFFTNLFSYSTRKQVCEHAYQATRRDLLKRRFELEPIFTKYGITINFDVLKDQSRTLDSRLFKRGVQIPKRQRLDEATLDLADTLAELDGFIAGRKRAAKTSV